MTDSCDETYRMHEGFPRITLAFQNTAGLRGDVVEAAPALTGLFDPSPREPWAFFEPIQKRIQGCDMEFQLPTRTRFDQLTDFISVTRPGLDNREDDQFSRPFFEFAIQ